MKGQVPAQVDRVMPKLLMEDARRIYLGVLPFDMAGLTNASISQLEALHTIMAIRLAAADKVLLVEREQLENVLVEQDLKRFEEAMVRSASHTIRGRIWPADSGRVRIEVQVRHGADEPVVVEATGDPKDREALAAELAGAVLRTLGVLTTNLAGNLQQEAELYFRNGQNYLAHRKLRHAVNLLHVATLLSPTNEFWTRTFFESVAQQMGGDVNRQLSVKEYLQDMARFEDAMDALLRLPFIGFPFSRHEGAMYVVLATVPKDLDEEYMLRVSQAHAAFKRAMEWHCAYPAGTPDARQMDRLVNYFPYMFDRPADAMTCLRDLSSRPGFRWSILWQSEFHRIRYWDIDVASRLWTQYMDELLTTDDPERQFAALASECYRSCAFDQHVRPQTNSGKAQKAAQQLFVWLQARPQNLEWMLQHAGWSIFMRCWNALHTLPDVEMEPAFRNVMMPIMHKDTTEISNCLLFLGTEYRWRRGERMTASDRGMLGGFLREVLADSGLLDEASRKSLVAHHRSDPWFSFFAGDMGIQEDLPYPSIPDATLLFDSTREDAGPGAFFDSFGGVLDEHALWIGWSVSGAVRIARISLTDYALNVYSVPANPKGCTGGCDPMLLARVGEQLCIVTYRSVTIVPVQDHDPYLATERACMLGPDMGDVHLGYDRSSGKMVISTLAGCGGAIYMGVEQEVADGVKHTTYGALLRWKPGMTNCEVIAASDALLSGPLNDCMPYEIVAACPLGDGRLCLLVANPDKPADAKPRSGIWTYDIQSGKWELVREVQFDWRSRGPSLPRFVTSNLFAFSEWNKTWFLDTSDFSLRNIHGRMGDADGVHGWTCRIEGSGEFKSQNLVRLAASSSEKDMVHYTASCWDFRITQVILQRDFVIVLVACSQPGGQFPSPRGLVYRIPIKP